MTRLSYSQVIIMVINLRISHLRSTLSTLPYTMRSHRIVWERATYTSFLPESGRVSNDLRDALVEEGRAAHLHGDGRESEKKSRSELNHGGAG